METMESGGNTRRVAGPSAALRMTDLRKGWERIQLRSFVKWTGAAVDWRT